MVGPPKAPRAAAGVAASPSTTKAGGSATSSAGLPTAAFICFLCRRKFASAQGLARHERLSELHKKNLETQDELVRQHKMEVLNEVTSVRQRLHDAASATGGSASAREKRCTALEAQLRQLLGECGMAQEMLEHGRSLRSSASNTVAAAAAAAGDVAKSEGTDEPARKAARLERPSFREARVGRLAVELGAACWQGGKNEQEDRYLLNMNLKSSDGQALAGFCVLDGHAGSHCVEHLVRRLAVHLQACLSSKPVLTEEAATQAMKHACFLADNEFLAQARKAELMDGSTMTLGLLFPEVSVRPNRPAGSCKLLIANVGDSRAVLCRALQGQAVSAESSNAGDGELEALRLSDDHKPDRPDEKKRIQEKGGVVDHYGVWRVFLPSPVSFGGRAIPRWGLAISRAFGDLLLKEPERYGCHSVKPGGLVIAEPEFRCIDVDPASDRFLVLACDGIWDVLKDEDAAAVCACQQGAELAAHSLVRHAFAAGSGDNLTAVVVTWRSKD